LGEWNTSARLGKKKNKLNADGSRAKEYLSTKTKVLIKKKKRKNAGRYESEGKKSRTMRQKRWPGIKSIYEESPTTITAVRRDSMH